MIGVDLRSLLQKLNPTCTRAFEAAAGMCVSRGHYEVQIEHVMLRLLGDKDSDLAQIFPHFEVEPGRVIRGTETALERVKTGATGKPVFSPSLINWLEESFLVGSVELAQPRIRSGTLLLNLILRPGRTALEDHTDEFDKIRGDELKRDFAKIVSGSEEDIVAAQEAEATPARPGAAAAAAGGEEALSRFTEDFTAKAAAGGIDPIVGRDNEIRQMIDVLSRRRKNNPMIVGEAGVGKTAVVEGFAVRVAEGDVPKSLQGVRVLSLDMGLLQAGASMKGEFENRLKNVIKEVQSAATPTILFIDEAHTMIGAGGAAGTGDAANLLKPPLARGELRTIGATTYSEYKKYIEKDPALERRFQPIQVDEPSIEITATMLRGAKEKYESYHGVRVLDSAVMSAAMLSDRYISGRQLPDKAVDLMDTACARVAIGQSAKPAMLDDLDRSLLNLDTAISALERDSDQALHDADEELAGLRGEQEKMVNEQNSVRDRWTAELELVQRVRALQTALAGPEPEVEDETEGETKGAEAAVETAGNTPNLDDVDLSNPAKLREAIETTTEELTSIQDGSPLVPLQVDSTIVGQVVSDWTGIPVGRMGSDDVAQVLGLEDKLRERVVGQDHALEILARKIRASKAGLQSPNQPMGVFLLVGTSGVGKTETATALADTLFGGDRFMVTVNMSEFMESHSVSKLIGSPPGYVGYGEGGVLTEAVRHRPYSVVLLDEIEKADPEVMNVFYQVFDKGTLADGEGRIIDFSNTIILMGSNLASDTIMASREEEEPPTWEDLLDRIRPELQQHLKPALLGRMTVVPYYPLSTDVLRTISEMKLSRVGQRLAAAHGMEFEIQPEARNALADRCQDPESGARNVDQMIDQNILPKISLALLEQMAEDKVASRLILGADESGEFIFEFSQD
jgi:type VI secretion system protein VasG